MDLMSIGDDEHLVKLILSDENLSDSMRNVIELFSKLMNNVVRKVPVKENEEDRAYLDEILRRKEFKMTTGELIRNEALLEGMIVGRIKGMIEVYFTKMKLQPHEIAIELKIDESEVNSILKELELIS